jgi:predicted KAP-like P-loop ATPase
MTQYRGSGWLADDPVDGTPTSPDRLGRVAFAEAAVRTLDAVASESPSSIVALIGPWGSGKSSILNVVSTLMGAGSGESSWTTVQFNPWFYQDLPSLQFGFFRELASALPSTAKWNRARKKIGEVGRTIAPLGSIGSLVGLDASKAIEFISKAVSGDESLAAARKAADEALKEAGSPVLVIIDDLDRLAPDELLLVFKLIRLTGRLTNLYYLVSYDEDTLLDALSRTGLIGESDQRRALDYLEKIIQVRLDVPPLRDHQVNTWVDGALNRLGQHYSYALNEAAMARFSDIYHEHLRARLDTPRAVKRYFGQVEAFLGAVVNEVDPVDFLLLTWIRTAEPLVYDFIYRERKDLLGVGIRHSVAFALNKIDPVERQKHWQSSLNAARVDQQDIAGVAGVLGSMFPAFRAEWAGLKYEGALGESTLTRISNPDYFDRYFSFSVPDEDIPDSTVKVALEQIRAGEEGAERGQIEQEFEDKASLIVDKLAGLLAEEQAPGGDDETLLLWLASRYSDAGDPNSFLTPKDQVRWLSQKMFASLNPGQTSGVLRAVAGFPDGLVLATRWIGYLERTAEEMPVSLPERQRLTQLLAAAAPVYEELLESGLRDYSSIPPFEIPDAGWQLLWRWREKNPTAVRAFIHERIDAGEWSALDTVGRLVTSARILGVPSAEWTIEGFDFAAIDDFIGLDKLFGMLSEELDALPADISLRERREQATPENRRKYALAQLKAVRDGKKSVVEYRPHVQP